MKTPAPLAPHYGGAALDSLLPSVAASLGSASFPLRGHDTTGDPLLPARRAVVVLIDGMGYELLHRRRGHAPFLRGLLPHARVIDAGFPSTTATSMGTFGTGRPPGSHGLLGYEVLIPGEDRLLNELSWQDGPDPYAWQPGATVFETLAGEGMSVTRVGPGEFDGSGLTNAALRGGRYVAARTLAERVDAGLAAVRADRRALVYLYWGDLDKKGHVEGAGSWQWGDELSAIDRELARLVEQVPSDTAVHITADHGMVDVPFDRRVDLADEADLDAGIRHFGGEPRAPQLHCQPGAAADVKAAWSERFAGQAWVLDRQEAVAAGWFGPVAPTNLARIGDVLVAFYTDSAVVDRRRMRPTLLNLLGVHGSLTTQEVVIPWFTIPARSQ
ncbi:MAG: alkaline phosphatase family protein [Nostocoides sp.]